MKKVIFYSTLIFVFTIALLGWDLYKIFSYIDNNASYYKSANNKKASCAEPS